MRSNESRARVGAAVIAALVFAAPACANAPQTGSTDSITSATVAEPAPTTRPSCEAALPASWQQGIDAGRVDTGGISNVPVAVGRGGEVAALRDNGGTRDVLLIGADKSVTVAYPVPEPERNSAGPVAMDDRWIVVGVERSPRGANGVLPVLNRIDVLDRQGGPMRTVAQTGEKELESGGATLDSFALFAGKVYWITRDTYAGDTGTIRSFDLTSGAVADVASGAMRNVRATAAGLAWEVAWNQVEGPRSELKIPDELPVPVAGALGTGRDQLTLASDGIAYAWYADSDRADRSVAYWSPSAGLVRVTGAVPSGDQHQPAPLFVVGPYVVIGSGRNDQKYDTFATVIDARSGAHTYLAQSVGGANGGTIGVGFGGTGKTLPSSAGVVRVDALPPLSC
jgi:hypothetical protein